MSYCGPSTTLAADWSHTQRRSWASVLLLDDSSCHCGIHRGLESGNGLSLYLGCCYSCEKGLIDSLPDSSTLTAVASIQMVGSSNYLASLAGAIVLISLLSDSIPWTMGRPLTDAEAQACSYVCTCATQHSSCSSYSSLALDRRIQFGSSALQSYTLLQ